MQIKTRKIKANDIEWIRKIFIQRWGGDFIVSRGKTHQSKQLEGYIAEFNDKKVGLVAFKITNQELEVISLDSFFEKKGIGAILINKVINFAKRNKLKRIWLVTTNDNLVALKFYQKRKFRLRKIYPSAIDKVSRKIKPQIPKIAENGIPIRDEIELEMIFRH